MAKAPFCVNFKENLLFFFDGSDQIDSALMLSAFKRCVKESAGNVWLELTAVPGERGRIEDLVRRVGSKRILYGTDLPWFDEYQAVGGVVSADITEDDMRNILYRNAESILGKDW